jgi:hypothetical protein
MPNDNGKDKDRAIQDTTRKDKDKDKDNGKDKDKA